MRRVALVVALAVLLPVAGCGDDGDGSSSDTESIMRSVRTYFLFDSSPDYNAYCQSYVQVHDQHTFRQGSPEALAREAATSQGACLMGYGRFQTRLPNHTGYRETQIGKVQEGNRDGRATVFLTYRSGGRTISAKALVAQIGDADWRVLRAGWAED